MSRLGIVVVVGLFGILPGIAVAQDPDPRLDRTLWCASAFNWLARDADDVGEAERAAIFDAWSLLFTERASTALADAGLDAGAIEQRIAASDRAVLDEMQHQTMRYDAERCPELETEGG